MEDMDLSSLDQLELQLNQTEMRLTSGGGLEGLDVLKNLDYRVRNGNIFLMLINITEHNNYL